ncbi:unnamed protein product [Rhizoctonia solani]|uniref:ATP-dependent DNA helicase n=1 Tax=Rhizoctonia solani TaxID=456999 RepID=A0A8H3C1V5_9AGAM|nr:unnamed protein product [Rhizoctonia solani]
MIWKTVEYMIIDKYSMISKEFLAKLSRHISIAKLEYNKAAGNLPFGGVNTILCGDLHQFPPIAASSNGALFHLTDLSRENPNDDRPMGRAIYEQFRTVVNLRQQIRAKDKKWREFLDRLRNGDVTDEDLGVLRSLTLTDPACRPTDFSSVLWRGAYLITPRHAVRTQWNELAVRHCHSTGAQLYICPANDLTQGKTGKRPLSLHEQYCSAQSGGFQKALGSRNGLPDEVFREISLKVMVTLNVETDLAVANGAWGTIVGIALAQNEPAFDPNSVVVTLSEPPAYILVKMDRTRAVKLKGLDNGVIPIVPAMKTYSFKMWTKQQNGEEKVIKKDVFRRQLPITPAYAFTDY